jgi:hypothetical protein
MLLANKYRWVRSTFKINFFPFFASIKKVFKKMLP